MIRHPDPAYYRHDETVREVAETIKQGTRQPLTDSQRIILAGFIYMWLDQIAELKKNQKKPDIDPDPLLKTSKVMRMVGITSRQTVHNWIRAGKLPPPIRINDRYNAWRYSTISKWVADKEAEDPYFFAKAE